MKSKFILTLLLMSATILLSACGKGSYAMTESMATKPVCAGRFVVDVPVTSSVRMDALYHGIQADNKGVVTSFDDIKETQKLRADKYNLSKSEVDPRVVEMLRAGGASPDAMLTPTQLVGFKVDDEKRQAIISYRDEPDSLHATAELYALIKGHDWLFRISQTSAGDFERNSATLSAVASHFEPIQKQMTSLPGFCVMGGIFTDDGKPKIGENMTLVIYDPAHKDMSFTVESSDVYGQPDDLSQWDVTRDLVALKAMGHDVRVIERGSHKAAGQDGYLVAVTGTDPSLEGARFYKYVWKAAGASQDVRKPSLEVELITHATNPSEETFKSADDVTAYFNTVLQSIRVRHSAQ